MPRNPFLKAAGARTAFGLLAGATLCALLSLAGVRAEEMTTEQFGQKLDQARELNVSAPWQESQALLDELARHLPQATRDQRVDYWLLVSRNQALAGDIEAGLETLRELLAGPMRDVQRARAYRRAANLTMIARKWEETFEYIIRGLELIDRLEGDEKIYAPFSLAAYLYALVGEYETATEYAHAAVENARSHGTMRDRCVIHGRLAFVHKAAGRYDTALEHYREAVSICLESGDDLFTGTIQSGFADLLRHAGEYDRAEEVFAQAFERLEATGYGPGLAEASLYKARLLEETDRLDHMRELLEDTLPRLRDQEVWDYVAEAREMLARAAAAGGEFRHAVEHMEQSLEARRRLLDQNRARQLAYLQVVFDTRTQRQELSLLREQRRAAELEAASRSTDRRIRWLASGAAVLALIALLLVLAHVLRGRQHFRRLSRLDSLTRIDNHTRFFQAAAEMLKHAQDDEHALTLIIGDVDHFKRVNDRFGHMAGDRALRGVARALRSRCPDGARLGRVGGEEFAACLPGLDRDAVDKLLERWRKALARIDYGGDDLPLTMSFGVARARPGESLASLRLRADEALYRAKNNGRDRIVFADAQ
jgi:diguanylate cyclase (GGDEF)-like protein